MNDPSVRSKINILNITMDNLTADELLKEFTNGLLVTPNIDHLMKIQKNRDFYQAYKMARFSVCDSRLIFLLSKLLFPNNSLKCQIAGSDFFPLFCEYHSQKNPETKVFLLGGTEQSVKIAKENINRRTNSSIVEEGYSPPFGFEKNDDETNKIIDLINESKADTLAIGVGAPKQEFWVCRHQHNLPHVKRFMAIGATIEFESGHLKRSPKWMTTSGLEWLYRLCQEPGRLAKRYFIEGPPFFLLFLKQRLHIYKNPWD